jgi:phospholipid transport system transporter-binding protein
VNKVNIILNHGSLIISGELSRFTVEQLNDNAFSHWFSHSAIDVNLHDLSKVDTAGLAWLLHLLEQAKGFNCQLSFSHIPLQLEKQIILSGINGFFPTTNS